MVYYYCADGQLPYCLIIGIYRSIAMMQRLVFMPQPYCGGDEHARVVPVVAAASHMSERARVHMLNKPRE